MSDGSAMNDGDMSVVRMPRVQDLTWPQSSARLRYRLGTPEDAQRMAHWRTRDEVNAVMGLVTRTPAELAAVWAEVGDDRVVAELDGAVVAHIKIDCQPCWGQSDVPAAERGLEATLGWALDPDLQGRGLGRELAEFTLALAFDQLHVRRVMAYAFLENEASCRLLERLGFRQEGISRLSAISSDRSWHDTAAYGMLADEHRARAQTERENR